MSWMHSRSSTVAVDPALLSYTDEPADEALQPSPVTSPVSTTSWSGTVSSSLEPYDVQSGFQHSYDDYLDVLTPPLTTENSGSSLAQDGFYSPAPAPPTQSRSTKSQSKHKGKHEGKKDKKDKAADGSASSHVGGKGKRRASVPSNTTTQPRLPASPYQASSRSNYPLILPSSMKPPSPQASAEPGAYIDDVPGEDTTQRQRNRIAANKSRRKRTAEINQLIEDERNASRHNQYLSACAEQLQTEVYNLNCALLEHRDCDCDLIRQYYETRRRSSTNTKHTGGHDSREEDNG